MKDQVFRIEYYVTVADDRPGVGADLGKRLKDEGVNLLALSNFPLTAGRTQVDLVPEHPEQFTKAARKLNLVVGEPKIAFLIQGNMAVSASRAACCCASTPTQTEPLISVPHVRRFEMRGRKMDGWLRVDAEAVESDDDLRAWVSHGVTYARSLCPSNHLTARCAG